MLTAKNCKPNGPTQRTPLDRDGSVVLAQAFLRAVEF